MEAKALLREQVIARRAARPGPSRDRAGLALAAALPADWLTGATVAAFASVGTEPPTRPMLDRLRDADVTVLLPVVVDSERLDWAEYAGWERLAAGRLGTLHPAGRRLGVEAVAAAEVVLVPALAVDRRGRRLGRGGGYYDRTLASLAGPAYAVVYDDEVVEEVPVEPHDVAVAGALTPSGLVVMTP